MHVTEQGEPMREQIIEDDELEDQGVEVVVGRRYLRARAGDSDLQECGASRLTITVDGVFTRK